MFNQDEGKIEFVVGNREMGYWQGKKAKIVLILFLTSGFTAFICLWLLVLPNSNYLINHILCRFYKKTKKTTFLIKKMITSFKEPKGPFLRTFSPPLFFCTKRAIFLANISTNQLKEPTNNKTWVGILFRYVILSQLSFL